MLAHLEDDVDECRTLWSDKGEFNAAIKVLLHRRTGAGPIAVGLAADVVRSGSHEEVIVVASDCRMGTGKSEFEQILDDGATAVVIGRPDAMARIDGHYWKGYGQEVEDHWFRKV